MKNPPDGDVFRRIKCHFSTLLASATAEPNMKVFVSAGGLWVRGEHYLEWEGNYSDNFSSPPEYSKYDLLCLNYNGYLEIINGNHSSDPSLSDCPRNSFPIAAIYLEAGNTTITDSQIFDLRPFFMTSPFSHQDVTDKSLPNAHPISSIISLQDELDNRPTHTQTNIYIDDKINTIDRFISPIKIGNGSLQLISHDLNSTPGSTFVSVVDTNGVNNYTIVEGEHDPFNLRFTVTDSVKYKIMAFKD